MYLTKKTIRILALIIITSFLIYILNFRIEYLLGYNIFIAILFSIVFIFSLIGFFNPHIIKIIFKQKNATKYILSIIISIPLILLILEPIARITYEPQTTDNILGTPLPTPNITLNLKIYPDISTKVQTYSYGSKLWGDTNTNKPKVLIIGDSFTYMPYVSNGKEYYSYLKEHFKNYEFFVIGQNGYGTFQEYQIIKQLHNIIKPNIIIVQFHPNDIINNNPTLEKKTYPLHRGSYRPYLYNNKIELISNSFLPKLRQKSAIINFLLDQYEIFIIRIYSILNFPKLDLNLDHTYIESAKTTNTILNNIQTEFPSSKLVTFFVTKSEHENIICKDIICYTDFHKIVLTNSHDDIYIPLNGHWSEFGNQLAATQLISYLESNNIMNN